MREGAVGRPIREDKILRFLSAHSLGNRFRFFSKNNLILALEKCEWKISKAESVSVLMGRPPPTITSRIKALGIRRPLK